jgi:signal peptidase I
MKTPKATKRLFTKDRLFALWHHELRPLLLLGTCLFAARSSLADWNDVPSGSMKPTILEGDRLLVNKLAYDLKVPFTTWRLAEWSGPERGEIVVFFSPVDGTRMVKRVVGTPGDVVEMRRGRLFINDQAAQYQPLSSSISDQLATSDQAEAVFASEKVGRKSHAVMGLPQRLALRDFGPVQVPAEHFFMMGDNRDNSLDSRSYGAVPMESVVGRAEAVVVSLDPDRWYLPRSQRWFRKLDQ